MTGAGQVPGPRDNTGEQNCMNPQPGMTIEAKHAELLAAAMPLIEWLNDHGNPHTTAIVCQARVEIVQGEMNAVVPAHLLRD